MTTMIVYDTHTAFENLKYKHYCEYHQSLLKSKVMTDLEETILKKNIPGKYSTWNDYSEDSRSRTRSSSSSCETGSENHYHQQIPQAGISATTATTATISGNRNRHHTGVKGVLADHREAKLLERIKDATEQKQREDAFRRATEGSRLGPGEVSISIASAEERKRLEKAKAKSNCNSRNNSGDSDGESASSDSNSSYDDDENDAFLENYRRLRLAELQNSALTIYSQVEVLESADVFSSVIDETDSRIFCIFHLFDNDVHSCRLLNQYLDVLAQTQKMRSCRYFKMEASVVKCDFDPIGYPCVLIYRGGNEVANLTPITSMFTKSSTSTRHGQFSIEDVECVLKLHCVM